jgi:hypothetical protein
MVGASVWDEAQLSYRRSDCYGCRHVGRQPVDPLERFAPHCDSHFLLVRKTTIAVKLF